MVSGTLRCQLFAVFLRCRLLAVCRDRKTYKSMIISTDQEFRILRGIRDRISGGQWQLEVQPELPIAGVPQTHVAGGINGCHSVSGEADGALHDALRVSGFDFGGLQILWIPRFPGLADSGGEHPGSIWKQRYGIDSLHCGLSKDLCLLPR